MTSIPGSDDWYLVRLCAKLGAGLPRMHRLTKYRDGDALLPTIDMDPGTQEAYRRFVRRSRLHVVETIRDARTDRQKVIGFRTGAQGDDNGDLAAWKHWLRNRMGIQSRAFFNDTADYGRSYILSVNGDDGALWQVRNEWDTITEQNTLRPWLTQAGLTVGYDDVLGVEVATLFRPGYYRIAYKRTLIPTLPKNGTMWIGGNDWTWASDPIPTPFTPDALLQKNQTQTGYGVYEKQLDSVDRINEITLNKLTLVVTQAFKQKAIEGDLPEFYPEDHPTNPGEKIDYNDLFKAGPAALWLLPSGAKVLESDAVDVRPVIADRKDELETLFSLTGTPLSILSSGAENQSATGSEISLQPLTNAVKMMNEQAEVALAQAMSTAFRMSGDTVRAEITDIEVMWDAINPPTLAEQAEAAPKFKAGGAPQDFIDERVFAMTPAQRRKAKDQREDDAFLLALAAPAATPATAAPAQTTDAARVR